MRYLIRVLCLVSIFLASAVEGQQVQRPRYFVMPREILLPVIVYQPDCPLEFSKASLICQVGEQAPVISYQVRNRGTKPIRSYIVQVFNQHGRAAGWGSKDTPLPELLWPGQACPTDPGFKIVPLTNEVREKSKVPVAMRGIYFFMVVYVEFADGSVYSDESIDAALEAFLDKGSLDRR